MFKGVELGAGVREQAIRLKLALLEMARSASRAGPTTRAASETVAKRASMSFALTSARNASKVARVTGAAGSAAASANWSIVASNASSKSAAVERCGLVASCSCSVAVRCACS